MEYPKIISRTFSLNGKNLSAHYVVEVDRTNTLHFEYETNLEDDFDLRILVAAKEWYRKFKQGEKMKALCEIYMGEGNGN